MTVNAKRRTETATQRTKRKLKEDEYRREISESWERGVRHGRSQLQRELWKLLGLDNDDSDWL